MQFISTHYCRYKLCISSKININDMRFLALSKIKNYYYNALMFKLLRSLLMFHKVIYSREKNYFKFFFLIFSMHVLLTNCKLLKN